MLDFSGAANQLVHQHERPPRSGPASPVDLRKLRRHLGLKAGCSEIAQEFNSDERMSNLCIRFACEKGDIEEKDGYTVVFLKNTLDSWLE